ncbi:Uncharacterised protein [uncultured archaeon]|nr:Uncharacterised protein [uncultured archaeon]
MKKETIAIMMAILIVLMPVQAQGPEDATPPDISNVLLTHGPTTLATWTTNEAANTKIEFGTTTAMNQTDSKPEYETAHSIILQTTEGTTYYYKITSCDQGNNCRSTTMDSFVAGPFYVKANIPRYARSNIIDIPGTTRPGAEVTVLVNNVEVRKSTIDDGIFLFRNIEIRQNSTLTLKSTLGTETAQASYQTEVDNQPPLINVTLPAVVTATSVTAKVKVSEPVSLTITYNNLTKNATAVGTSDIKIDNLAAGENIITFTAKDKAGYTSIAEERIIYDTGPPEFLSHNLKELTPSYRQNVHAKGKLSEPGSITVFVNGKPQKTEPTNPDGTFSIEVKLERTPKNETTEQRTSLDTGLAWKNKVRLEAVDAAGQKKSTEEVEIEYTLCGQGTWIDVTLTDPLPDRLNPRLLIEGIQQIGIAFNYTYRGGYKATIEPRNVRIKALQLAPEFENEYDNPLVLVNSPTKAQRGKKPTGSGYIQVNFNPITDPWALEGETAPSNATMYDNEKKISEHRQGHCTVPDFGCMKLFLELEIPFSEEMTSAGYLPETTQGVQKITKSDVQKTCVNVEVMIDKRVPPDALPEGFLRSTSKGLGKIVENIDKVLKPVQTVGQYVMYTCVAGQYLSLIPLFLEKYNCQYKTVMSAAGGKGQFKQEIAQIGACEKEYEGQDEAKDNCQTCQKAIERRKWYDKAYRQVCDRVMCPAAPSLQYYLKTKGTQKPVPVKTKEGDKQMGSDCAAWVQEKDLARKLAEEETAKKEQRKPKIPPKLFFSSTDIQKIYGNWLDHKGDSSDKEGGGINCAGNHPATPDCCGVEYMNEWSSACGVSALGSGLDTFNEIEESACLSAQANGKNDFTAAGQSVGCSNLLNSLGGFCTKNGGPPMTTIKVAALSEGKVEEFGMSKYGENNDLYIVVQEQMSGGGFQLIQVGKSKGHTVKLGMVVRTLEFGQSKTGTGLAEAEHSRLTEKLEIAEYPGYDIQKFFTQELIDAYREKQTVPAEFGPTLCEAAGQTTCTINTASIYGQVIGAIGDPEKEYIIRPNDGLINSIRCICFPTFIAYLKLWRNIMSAVKNCIDVILITGDGEAGVCEAVISQYACDLIYEVLTCFTQSFSTGGARTGIAGTGDLLGALTAAGSEMARTSEGRYGDSSAYKTVFVEKKLVNSICMWAFTGTWNFDVAAAFDQSVEEVPIDSYALLEPANRRFVAFNPATTPSGLTTWVYHFGIGFAAGADSDLELHLKCSGGFKCREADGFERGKCDCETEKDITISPEGFPTHVKKNEILSQEVFYTMQGSGQGNIRYDKAYLLYRFKDGSKSREERTDEKTITQSGGAGALPAFCRYDPATFSFRCMFGDAGSGIRFGAGAATYTHPTIPTFAIGDRLNISLNITQDYPGKEANIKHIEYAVYNSAGQMIKNNTDSGLIMLTTNGDYTKTIADIPIDTSWFGVATTPTGTAAPINIVYQQWWSKQPSISPTNTVIDSVKLTSGLTEVNQERKFGFEIYRNGTSKIYQIYKDATMSASGIAGTKVTGCAGNVPGNIITCPIEGQTLTINIKPDIVPGLDDGEKYQVYIDYNAPTSAINLCSPDTKTTPSLFKIKLTAYDSDQYGQPTDQISIDPITGNDATIEIPFNVVCAATNDKDLIAKETGVPALLAATQLFSQFSTLNNNMLATENTHKNKINDYLTKTQDLASIAEQIKTDLNQLITDESSLANELNLIVRSLETLSQQQPANQNLQQLFYKARDLYNMLRMPTQAEQTAPTPTISEINVIYAAKIALDGITKQTIPNTTEIRKQLQEFYPFLEEAIKVKSTVPALISAVGGAGTGPCPVEGTIEADGAYYVCASSKPAPWEPVTNRPCQTLTAQTCYKLPKTKYCDATNQGFKFKCASQCTPESQITTELYCDKQVCCKTPVAEINAFENKILELSKFVSTKKELHEKIVSEQITPMQSLSDEDLIKKKVDIQNLLMALSTQMKTEQSQIKQKLADEASTEGFKGNLTEAEDVFVDLDVLYYEFININGKDWLLEAKGMIQNADAQSIRYIISDTKMKMNILISNEGQALKSLTSSLGVRGLCPSGTSEYQCGSKRPTGYDFDPSYQCPQPTESCYRKAITAKPATTTAPGAQAPPVAKVKMIPAYLGVSCGEGYVSKGRFNDDNKNWAYAYESTDPRNEKQNLNLCVVKGLENDVVLREAVKDYQCETGWKNKGWIKNDFKGWAVDSSGYILQANEYLHLCISDKAINTYGDFAYLAFIGNRATTTACSSPRIMAGTFELAYMPSPAGSAYVNAQGTEYPPAWAGDVGTKWFGLCVQEISIEKPVIPPKLPEIKPAYLGAYCGDKYVSKGRFSDDNVRWAYPDGSIQARNEKQPLILCVLKELTDSVELRQAIREYYCDPGWTHKGYVKNDFNNWATDSGGYVLQKDEYLHFCVKNEAIDKYGDFMHLAFMGTKGNTQYCETPNEIAGMFEIAFMPGTAEKYVEAMQGNIYERFSPSDAVTVGTKWVGLCVKPVVIGFPEVSGSPH